MTQLQAPGHPQTWDQDRDKAGKPLASLVLATPSSETSEQNVPIWELGTSLLRVVALKKTLHSPRQSLMLLPAHRRLIKEITSTTALGSY